MATNGSDSNPGTADSPWRTIQKGLNTVRAGETLYIRSGIYVQTAQLKISNSGSAGDGMMITISTAPGEPSLAVISGDTNGDGLGEVPSQGSYSALVELRGSYIRFQNLEVGYSGGHNINSTGSHNIVSGNKVHNSWRTGIQVQAADNLIEKNTVWRSSENNYCNGSVGRMCNGNWAAGIAWGDAHGTTPPGSAPRTTVRGNTVYDNSGEGIICMHTDNALIEGNVAYDNWALNIDLDQCSYSTVQKNLVYATGDKSWWRKSDGPATGIMLSNEGIQGSSGGTYPVGHDRKIINNIMVGNGSNFYFWKASLSGSALVNDLIANNTMIEAQGSGATGLKIDSAPHSNSRIFNNIVVQSSGNVGYAGSTGGLTFGNNLWSRTPPSGMSSSSDVISTPLLVNPNPQRTPGGVQAEWFKLKDSTSPAIGKALSLPEVTVDFWNNLRSSRPDIGAHQYNP